jgi:type II secretory pathway pseudopilin PulG
MKTRAIIILSIIVLIIIASLAATLMPGSLAEARKIDAQTQQDQALADIQRQYNADRAQIMSKPLATMELTRLQAEQDLKLEGERNTIKADFQREISQIDQDTRIAQGFALFVDALFVIAAIFLFRTSNALATFLTAWAHRRGEQFKTANGEPGFYNGQRIVDTSLATSSVTSINKLPLWLRASLFLSLWAEWNEQRRQAQSKGESAPGWHRVYEQLAAIEAGDVSTLPHSLEEMRPIIQGKQIISMMNTTSRADTDQNPASLAFRQGISAFMRQGDKPQIQVLQVTPDEEQALIDLHGGHA